MGKLQFSQAQKNAIDFYRKLHHTDLYDFWPYSDDGGESVNIVGQSFKWVGERKKVYYGRLFYLSLSGATNIISSFPRVYGNKYSYTRSMSYA
jgi:hypothetical protein